MWKGITEEWGQWGRVRVEVEKVQLDPRSLMKTPSIPGLGAHLLARLLRPNDPCSVC